MSASLRPIPVDADRLGDLLAAGRTAEIHAWSEGQVVKLYRRGWGIETALREARASALVGDGTGPGPRFGGIVELDGRYGLVLEWLDGTTMLDVLAQAPWRAIELARRMAALQREIHERIPTGLPIQSEVLAGWIRRAEVVSPSIRAHALGRLRLLAPTSSLCHGNLHPANVVLARGRWSVIDWASAVRGAPNGDVARSLLLLRHAAAPARGGLLRRSLLGPVRATFATAYRARMGIPASELRALELAMVVARIGEDVPGERDGLLRRLRAIDVG